MAISYVNGDISTSDNVDTVAGLSFTGLGHAAGDWCLGVWALFLDPTTALDARFTEIDNDLDQNLRAILFELGPMAGTESGAVSLTTTGTNAVNRMAAGFGIWRGVGSRGTFVNFTEGGTASDLHPTANNLSITPTADNALIVLVYAERSSTGNTAGTLTPPTHVGTGTAATVRRERGTGSSGGTFFQIAEFQLGAGTAGVAQTFTQWNATPDTLVASNAEMWLIPLYPSITAVDLTVNGATQGHTAESPTLTQVHSLTVAGATQAQSAESPSLTQVHSLTVAGATQAHAAESPTLTQTHVLTVASATQTHTADSPTLTQAYNLTVQGATQAQTADAVTLTQQHTLAVANASQGHTAQQVTLTVTTDLVVDSATQAQASSTVNLTQDHNLAVNGAVHLQSASTVTIVPVVPREDLTVIVGPTRVGSLTAGPTRQSLTVDGTRDNAAGVAATRSSISIGPTRRDRGA